MTIVVERKKSRVLVWSLVAVFVTGLLIVIGSIWDWTKIPVTPTTILWFVTIVTAVIFGLIYLGSRESKRQQPTTAAGAHHPAAAEANAPAAHAKESGHGHMSKGQSFLYWSLGALVVVCLFFAVAFGMNALLGRDGPPGVGGSVARSSRIPVSACSVPPADAAVVLAPVEGCSRAFPVPSHSYGCVDPGPSSGLVRVKSWYEGNPEPSSWDNGVSRGNQRCFGSVGSTPATVHIWSEPQSSN